MILHCRGYQASISRQLGKKSSKEPKFNVSRSMVSLLRGVLAKNNWSSQLILELEANHSSVNKSSKDFENSVLSQDIEGLWWSGRCWLMDINIAHRAPLWFRNPISQDLESGGDIDLSSNPLHISIYLHLLNPFSLPTMHIQIQIWCWFLFGHSSLKIAWIFRFFPRWSYFFCIRHPNSLVVFLWFSAIMIKMKQIMQRVWGVVFCI